MKTEPVVVTTKLSKQLEMLRDAEPGIDVHAHLERILGPDTDDKLKMLIAEAELYADDVQMASKGIAEASKPEVAYTATRLLQLIQEAEAKTELPTIASIKLARPRDFDRCCIRPAACKQLLFRMI